MIIGLRAEVTAGIIDERLHGLHFRLALGLRPAISFAFGIVARSNIVVEARSIGRAIVRAGRVVSQSPLVAVIAVQVNSYGRRATAKGNRPPVLAPQPSRIHLVVWHGLSECESIGIHYWNDPDLKINWENVEEPILSDKDRKGVRFRNAEVFA